NPAFITLILRNICAAFEGDEESPLPFIYAFVLPPLILNSDIRLALPQRANALFSNWALDNRSVLVGFGQMARDIEPLVRRSLLWGIRRGVLILGSDGLRSIDKKELRVKEPKYSELMNLAAAASLVGRWVRKASVVEVCNMLRVSP
ncbi:MAG TPA: three component ABC system middle component, partial [Candidatus Acidoferrales bacterium]|nr:three component ABC system middle component [Candidatus Acidoferrales bacterium]